VVEWKKASKEEKARVMARCANNYPDALERVRPIIDAVKKEGDVALLRCASQFDGVSLTPERLRVSKKDFDEAYAQVGEKRAAIIRRQIVLSRKFAQAQAESFQMRWETQICEGVRAGVKWTPLDSVGLYVPGGSAPYPTVMQILAVPAKIAGVKRVVACVPAKNCCAEVLVAAKECGVDEVYRIGGPAAIAAMAFGTATIKRVLKIAGPGSMLVTAAKLAASSEGVAIDMPAGPSEVLIIAEEPDGSEGLADEGGLARLIAADMISANEHGKSSASVLVTPSRKLAEQTALELGRQVLERERKQDILDSLKAYSAIVLVDSLDEAISFANEYAPEHLQVITKQPREVEAKLTNAGTVFLGKWNCKAFGDYAIGLNHVLPTGQGAKAYSPVGVQTFLKATQFAEVDGQGVRSLSEIVEEISTAEGFDGHRICLRLRLKMLENSRGEFSENEQFRAGVCRQD